MGLTRQQVVVVTILLAGVFVCVLNQTLLSPALPVIMNDLFVDPTTVQWLTSGYSLVEAVVFPLSAYIMGRFPTRPLYIGGMAVFAAGTLLGAFAPFFGLLLAGRMIQAVATGALWPMVMTVILIIFPREKRGSAMGLVGLIIGFAPAIGPSLSGILVDTIGWRAQFVLVAALMAVILVFAIIFLKNYGEFERITFDKPSVALIVLGLLALLYGLSSITSGDQLWLCVGLIIVGVILIVVFVRRQLTLETPLLRVDVLKIRNFRINVIAVGAYQMGLVGTGVLFPIYIQNVMGYSPLQTGLVMLPGAICGAIIGLVAGRLFDRFGARKIVLPGSLVAFIGGAGLTMYGLDTTLIFMAAVYTILVIGMQFTMTPLNTWGINSVENSKIQHANAVSNTVSQTSASLGTALLVTLSSLSLYIYPDMEYREQTMMGDHIAFLATALIMLAVFVALIFLVRDRQESPSERANAILEEVPVATSSDISVAMAMNADPYFVRADETIRDVAKILVDKKTSGIPVVDQELQVVGFISDGDIMKYIGRQDRSILDTTNMLFQFNDQETYADRFSDLMDLEVMKIATPNVMSVEVTTPLEDVCRILSERRIKKMPVVDQGKLVGSVSRSDIIRKTMKLLAADAHGAQQVHDVMVGAES